MHRHPRIVLRVPAALAALAVTLLAALAVTPAAGALTARFAVNDGKAYTRQPTVAVGDGGWSPFFGPAVVVWDGGSIVAGHGAAPGSEFPAQTLALVPRVCKSYVSSIGGAKIASMLADAPYEVDARYRATADLDLCVVLAGGGDFRAGASAADVYAALKAYCAARRAAGFRVVVLTVLPAGEPVTFEATRLAYDAMLRSGCARVRRRSRRHRRRRPHRRHGRQPRPAVLPVGRPASDDRRQRGHGVGGCPGAERAAVAVGGLRAAPAGRRR